MNLYTANMSIWNSLTTRKHRFFADSLSHGHSPNVRVSKRSLLCITGEIHGPWLDIRRTHPVEVGSLIPLFAGFWKTSKQWLVVWDFWNISGLSPINTSMMWFSWIKWDDIKYASLFFSEKNLCLTKYSTPPRYQGMLSSEGKLNENQHKFPSILSMIMRIIGWVRDSCGKISVVRDNSIIQYHQYCWWFRSRSRFHRLDILTPVNNAISTYRSLNDFCFAERFLVVFPQRVPRSPDSPRLRRGWRSDPSVTISWKLVVFVTVL